MSTVQASDQRDGSELLKPIARLLPVVALYLRISVGIGLLSNGLVSLVGSTQNGFGGPFGGGSIFGPGMEPIAEVLPYVNLVIGLALIVGFFTTLFAMIAAAASFITPLLTSFMIVASFGMSSGRMGGMGGMSGLIDSILMGTLGVQPITYVALILLSPMKINKYSLDTLIYNRPAAILPPRPSLPGITDNEVGPGAQTPIK
jgi:uncharacterized membrane protein YphA (DoxX/SURF4 family)